MKKTNYKKIILSVLAIFILSSISVCAITYTQLEPNAFPGVAANSNLKTFLSQVFNFGIAIAVALSLIMIIWGGIIMMTTDAWQKKDEAKSKIENALWGLGLALISWLLLYTINPDLVKFNNNTLLNSITITTNLS